MAPLLVSADQFTVGGEKGWAKPTGNDSETYNEWASQNRFHVGDEACKFSDFTCIGIFAKKIKKIWMA